MIKNIIKKITPASWLSFYHKTIAHLADCYYHHPSNKMIVIGVTGTKGKTTTSNIIWHLLTQAGYKTGLASTANFRINRQEWVNKYKMTMLGRFKLQKLLNQMVQGGCQYAVVETSSEGIEQWRHWGINYDIAIFLNLSPEHIESHGSYENYKQAKGKLFDLLSRKEKRIKQQFIKKTIIANNDDAEVQYFLNFPAEIKVTYGLQDGPDVLAKDLQADKIGISFSINDFHFSLKQLGLYNIYNVLPAVAVGLHLGMPLPLISEYLASFPGMPGRMEIIDQGQPFMVVVDYAYEPKCLEAVLKTIQDLYIRPELKNKIIAVSGQCGGGRDKWRWPVVGELLSKYCQEIILTTDDPYDDDPSLIADEMINGITKYVETQNFASLPKPKYQKIINRREAIKQSFALAKPNDVVLLAGKGSDPVMAVKNGKYIPWDDRQVARELLSVDN